MTLSLRPSYALQPPRRLGGLPCLDFVNTETWRGEPEQREEGLSSYDELLLWSEAAELLDPAEAAGLHAQALARPAEAAAALVEAKALRAALGDLFVGKNDGDGLRTVNRLLAAMPPSPRLRRDLRVETPAGTRPLLQPLWPVLRDALALLSNPQWRERVHCCDNARCRWLFLDLSRNGLRRWCSMETCGNRAKAQRHYAGHRGKPAF